MSEKIVVGPVNRGFKNNREAFVIDNDSFPTLINAYQWRGRIKRKRGTSLLGRLQRFFSSTSQSYNPGAFTTPPTTSTTLILNGSGAGNLFDGDGLGVGFNIIATSPNASIVPGTVTITDVTGAQTYTDPLSNGILVGSLGGSGTINYATGAFTIVGGAGHTISATFWYYPDLPVMGLEDLQLNQTSPYGTIAFDTVYSYNILTSDPYTIYDVSFFKNPANATYLGYLAKTFETLATWNGRDYQQFWTINYEGAFWATNGMTVPFSTTNIGMQYKNITGMNITLATAPLGPSIVTLTIAGHGLVVGDFIFVNEVVYTAPNITNSINFQTGYVIAVIDANNVSVEFPNAYLTGTYASGGIAQYLTSRANPTLDCIRWYDGDPTNGNITTPVLNGTHGWVNFMPPLSASNFSIADLPPAQYYLVGAKMVMNFKDRLLALGAVIQRSGGSPIYVQDTIIYCQNGTPYYTASFTGDPTLPNTTFHEILVPLNQTATANAWFEDETGFGGNITAGFPEKIITCAINKDVLVVGFETIQTRVVYTGMDIIPFNFFIINSELGSGSTFSVINMNDGIITLGSRGYVTTSQEDATRIDLDIPDEVFEISLVNNGAERVSAKRDFINEWIYFSFPGNEIKYKFPNQTLQYNYRDNSWALFYESYTHYGTFKARTGFIWQTVGRKYPTWNSWTKPWNAGSSTLEQPLVIAGNQQGFVMFRDEGTDEATSLYIQDITNSTVTSPQHGLNNDDYITISGVLGALGSQVNGFIFQVASASTDTFLLNPLITGGTFIGGGLIKRMYVPFVQTKQFPIAWEMARKTRIGPQKYLLTTTNKAQIQLLIYLSQNADDPYNDGPIVPQFQSDNNSLIYSTVLYTCPESTNIGLTPANTNLNMPTSVAQRQTWHRINTSLIGDTVQLGFTMSDEQMRSLEAAGEIQDITAITLGATTILIVDNNFKVGQLLLINGVVGTTELNGNIYAIIAASATDVTIDVDSTAFTTYISDGTAVVVGPNSQFAEIELHGFIMDISPSQMLA